MIESRWRAGPPPPVPPLMIYSFRLADSMVQVVVAGEVDLATFEQLRAALLPEVGGNREVVVDLSEVTFLDATGIGVLGEAQVAARRAGGGFRLHNPQGIVRRVLEVIGAAEWGIPSRPIARPDSTATAALPRSAVSPPGP